MKNIVCSYIEERGVGKEVGRMFEGKKGKERIHLLQHVGHVTLPKIKEGIISPCKTAHNAAGECYTHAHTHIASPQP